jgi:hypothetical protein
MSTVSLPVQTRNSRRISNLQAQDRLGLRDDDDGGQLMAAKMCLGNQNRERYRLRIPLVE